VIVWIKEEWARKLFNVSLNKKGGRVKSQIEMAGRYGECSMCAGSEDVEAKVNRNEAQEPV
jgi:hypothetical protein